MANLNAWMITGRVKSMEEIKGGIGCVSVDIECAPFERYDDKVFTFSFHFYGKDKEKFMATVSPGDTITVSGKIITDQNGCAFIMSNYWSLNETMKIEIEGEDLEEIASAIRCHIRRMKRDLKRRERTAEVYEKVGNARALLVRGHLPGLIERIKHAEKIFEKIQKKSKAMENG